MKTPNLLSIDAKFILPEHVYQKVRLFHSIKLVFKQS